MNMYARAIGFSALLFSTMNVIVCAAGERCSASTSDPLVTLRQGSLMDAIWANKVSAVWAALQAGADVNTPYLAGMPPLLAACAISDIDPRIVSLLIKHGADCDVIHGGRQTTLLATCKESVLRRDVIDLLIGCGAAINMTRGGGLVTLLAVWDGSVVDQRIIFSLVECNIHYSISFDCGTTPLLAGCINQRIDLVALLLINRVTVTAAILVRAMNNPAISDLLRRHVDRLVQEALAGNRAALSQCRDLAIDCQAAVDHFQALINQRQHAKSVEEEHKACEDFDKEVVVLDKHRRRDILASCAFDIAQYQRSCELLLSYKEAYTAYIDV